MNLWQRSVRPTRLDQMSGASRLGAIASAAAQERLRLSLEDNKRGIATFSSGPSVGEYRVMRGLLYRWTGRVWERAR